MIFFHEFEYKYVPTVVDVVAQAHHELPPLCTDSTHRVENKLTALLAELIVFIFVLKRRRDSTDNRSDCVCSTRHMRYGLAFTRILFIIHSECIHHRIIMSLSTLSTVPSVSFIREREREIDRSRLHSSSAGCRSQQRNLKNVIILRLFYLTRTTRIRRMSLISVFCSNFFRMKEHHKCMNQNIILRSTL